LVLALSSGYRFLRGQVGMGFGDVMLMGMVGASLGGVGAAVVLFAGACGGTLYALVRQRGTLDGTARLPFGTFLALAAAGFLLGGDRLVAWYLTFLRTA
jgi:leader peptidase (prepilin peptidase)/N-methyltransferase